MKRQHRAFLSFPATIIAAIVMLLSGSHTILAQVGHGGGGGHGGGPGHAINVGRPGYYGYGWRGYGPGYRGYYGYGYGYPWWGFGFGLGLGVGYGLGYGYPYYPGYYGYAYPDYPPPPNGYPAPGQVPPPAQAPPRTTGTGDAILSVRAPDNATIWVNGQRTTQSGARREFVSAGLAPGRKYTYEVRAQWTGSDGKLVDITQRLPLEAGVRREVDFTAATESRSGLAPAAVGAVR
jgi:uncharacterized protein (TIGR03000 family)